MKRFEKIAVGVVGFVVLIVVGLFLAGLVLKINSSSTGNDIQQVKIEGATDIAPPPAPETPAPDATAQPQADVSDPICDEANDVRFRVCMASKVDCQAIMQSADPKLVEHIKSCPVTGPTAFAGEQKVGGIPCCVPMGPVENGLTPKQ